MRFTDLNELTTNINIDLGHFCADFQYKRKELCGKKPNKKDIIFNSHDTFSYNDGAKDQIQYHISLNNHLLKFGLGFNTQPGSFYEKDIIKEMKPYMRAFIDFEEEIRTLLPDFEIIDNNKGDLFIPKYNNFILFGKQVEVKRTESVYEIDEKGYQSMLSIMKNGQFTAYQLIFKNRNEIIKEQIVLREEQRKMNIYTTLLKSNKNLVLTGAPGTGKTYLAKEIAKSIILEKNNFINIDITKELSIGDTIKTRERTTFSMKKIGDKSVIIKPEEAKSDRNISFEKILKCITDKTYNGPTSEVDNSTYIFSLSKFILGKLSEQFFDFVQFHPSYDYTDFVEGLRPVKHDGNKELGFELKNGAFKAFCKTAKEDPTNNYVFIIDEINRAEISKVFGELFFAIDPGYPGEKGKVRTQYSNMQNEKTFFTNLINDEFFVPKNVYIIATMNDIDRSVESFDFAMRRRFAWKEVKAEDRIEMLTEELPSEIATEAINRMTNLNKAIFHDGKGIDGLNSSYHIGPAYFLKIKRYINEENPWQELWKYHLETLLKEYLRGMPSSINSLNTLEAAYENTVS